MNIKYVLKVNTNGHQKKKTQKCVHDVKQDLIINQKEE
jgi:hypothetical protein